MAESPTPRAVKHSAPKRAASMQDRVDSALKQAAKQAKRHLATNGLKLPTQSWTGAVVKNPAA